MTETITKTEPVRADWKISEVLRRYPQLLDVLIGTHPAFSRLRNPVLRRVQTRLVTVEQAARIAGLEPAALVRRLNAALGLPAEDGGEAAGAPVAETADEAGADRAASAPAEIERAPVAAEVDARPLIERGEEPFHAIMQAAATVPLGQALRLRNSFEPVPLYTVLGKQGFVHLTRWLGPDDWEVLFMRVGRAAGPAAAPGGDESLPEAAEQPAAAPAALPEGWAEPSATVTIDVSDLVPPEPMVRILEALERLEPGRTLLVHHVRRPVYLYPRLDELGYQHVTREIGPGQVEILIHKPAGGAQRSE